MAHLKNPLCLLTGVTVDNHSLILPPHVSTILTFITLPAKTQIYKPDRLELEMVGILIGVAQNFRNWHFKSSLMLLYRNSDVVNWENSADRLSLFWSYVESNLKIEALNISLNTTKIVCMATCGCMFFFWTDPLNNTTKTQHIKNSNKKIKRCFTMKCRDALIFLMMKYHDFILQSSLCK